MSKPSDEYCTPQWLYDSLLKEFGPLQHDVACTLANKKCFYYSTDALHTPWFDGWFCNPPFSRIAKDKWIEYATAQHCFGKRGVMILPARVMSNRAFHDALAAGAGLVVIKGRVAFELGGKPQPACPWPTIVLVFGGAK